jgi:hypothetical protein
LTTASLHRFRALGVLALAAAGATRAGAILEFDEGRDRITVNAGYGITYDSNLFAHAGSEGDYNQSLSAGAAYVRRAGLIGVDATVSITTTRFRKFSSEDFTNPSFTLDLSKAKGRLTGSFRLSAGRENRGEVTANERTTSWHYGSALTLRYPFNERYYVTSTSSYDARDFGQTSTLYDLSSYSEALDAFYVYSSKLDLFGGYRIRQGDAQGGARSQDHAVTLGATGGILPKLSGSLRAGYQWRHESGAGGGNYGSLTTNFTLTWPVTKQVTIDGQASKDFMTSATDIDVDATAFVLTAALKPNLRLNATLKATASYNVNRFLGIRGGGREDRAAGCSADLSLPLIAHVSAALSYNYTDNHSNVAFARFVQHTATFKISAQY